MTGARADRRELNRMLGKLGPGDVVTVTRIASGLAKLLKLRVKGLPVGRDAGIADKPFVGVSFGHVLCKP